MARVAGGGGGGGGVGGLVLLEASGNMTFKSAYWLVRDQNFKECHPEVLSLSSTNPIKENIWKVRTAPKIKNLLVESVK